MLVVSAPVKKMAAVQDGGSELDGEKEPQPDLLSDGSAAPAAAPAPKPEEQQTLLAVLQFLKRNKLCESVDALRREAGLPDEPEEAPGSEAAGAAGSTGAELGDNNSLLSRVSAASQSVAVPAPAKGGFLKPNKIVKTAFYTPAALKSGNKLCHFSFSTCWSLNNTRKGFSTLLE